MRTIGNKVIVKPVIVETESIGGIIIPNSFIGRTAKAVVVAVGCGTKDRPMKIPVGVECLHVPGAGDEIEENGEKYYVIADTDIRAYYQN